MVAHTLIPAVGKQKQEDICELRGQPILTVSSRPAEALSQKPNKQKIRSVGFILMCENTWALVTRTHLAPRQPT